MLGAVRVQPRERGIHVIQLRREARLAAQPVFARGDREPRGDDALERLRVADAGREHLAAPAEPPPAVQEHDEGRTRGVGRSQIERERTETGRLSDVDLEDRRHGQSRNWNSGMNCVQYFSPAARMVGKSGT